MQDVAGREAREPVPGHDQREDAERDARDDRPPERDVHERQVALALDVLDRRPDRPPQRRGSDHGRERPGARAPAARHAPSMPSIANTVVQSSLMLTTVHPSLRARSSARSAPAV